LLHIVRRVPQEFLGNKTYLATESRAYWNILRNNAGLPTLINSHPRFTGALVNKDKIFSKSPQWDLPFALADITFSVWVFIFSFLDYTKHLKMTNTFTCCWRFAWEVNFGHYYETSMNLAEIMLQTKL
jgi:hypothetical protein